MHDGRGKGGGQETLVELLVHVQPSLCRLHTSRSSKNGRLGVVHCGSEEHLSAWGRTGLNYVYLDDSLFRPGVVFHLAGWQVDFCMCAVGVFVSAQTDILCSQGHDVALRHRCQSFPCAQDGNDDHRVVHLTQQWTVQVWLGHLSCE